MDRLNDRIARILVERARLVARIVAWKRRRGRRLYDPAREAEMVRRAAAAAAPPLPPAALARIFREIIRSSRPFPARRRPARGFPGSAASITSAPTRVE
jgi:chorismate mutase